MLLGVATGKDAFDLEWSWDTCCCIQFCDALRDFPSRESYFYEVRH
jgi:hypothetical protein